jgi:predicted Zn-dependent protease
MFHHAVARPEPVTIYFQISYLFGYRKAPYRFFRLFAAKMIPEYPGTDRRPTGKISPMTCPCCSRRRFATGLLASVATLTIEGCVGTNPAGRSSMASFSSYEDDVRLGQREAPRLTKEMGGAYEDPRINAYVTDIGLRLAIHTEHPELPFRFTILNSSIVNAFALPGGQIFISRGLMALAGNEAEVAGVLAHELGHVMARHTAERMNQATLAQVGLTVLGVVTGGSGLANLAGFGAQAYLQGFSRDQESEADLLGVRYMTKAGYDPDAMTSFLASLREESMLQARMAGRDPDAVDEFNLMATHPRTIERVKQAQAQAQIHRPPNAQLRRDEYLTRIDGMLYGDDPEQGIAEGRRFVHPGLRFEYEVPEGFRIVNSPDKVVAKHPKGAVVLFDMGKAKRARSAVDYIRSEWLSGASSLGNLESIAVDGMPAATATTRGTMNNQAVDVRVVAIPADGDAMFRLTFLTPSGQAARWATDFQRTTYGFRRISAAEAAKVRGHRLLVVKARAGDTADRLAATMPFGKYNGDAFRVLNDLRPGQEVAPGQYLKVIAS